MSRRRSALLVFLLFALGLAASSSAVPLLVELKFRDPIDSLENPRTGGDDELRPPGKSEGKGKSNEKSNGKSDEKGKGSGQGGSGNAGNPNDEADLKSLTLWLSSDGKEWEKISSDLISYSSDKITAQITGKGKGATKDFFGSVGQDITGEPKQSYYVGLSTSSSSYTGGGTMNARLVSWQFLSKTNQPSSIPEPAIWPLFAAGAIALGFAFAPRRKK